MFFSGCGGGGESTTHISGNIADGYLIGAKVCADANNDKVCQDSELQTTLGAKGAFTLLADAANNPIIAEVTTSTIDEDTDAVVVNAHVLSAPKGKTFI